MDAGPDLFEAIRAGDTARVRRIVESDGGLVNARNAQGQSAVLMACYMVLHGAARDSRPAGRKGRQPGIARSRGSGKVAAREELGGRQDRAGEELFAGRISCDGAGRGVRA